MCELGVGTEEGRCGLDIEMRRQAEVLDIDERSECLEHLHMIHIGGRSHGSDW